MLNDTAVNAIVVIQSNWCCQHDTKRTTWTLPSRAWLRKQWTIWWKKMYTTVTHVQQNVKVFNVKLTKLFLQRHVPDLTRARQFPVSNMLHIDNKLKTEAEMLPERFSKNQEKDKSEKIKNTALLGFINSLKCRYRMSYKKLTNFTNKCWAT